MNGAPGGRMLRSDVWPWLLAGVVLIVAGLIWGSLVNWAGIEMVPMALGAGFFGVGVARILKGD
ncbi:hypothetical protein [Branchiibius sp. NY16-3462-2]|uniref:hypothetical protein n=1 Tax=Branchiibius sp. NY16-3462-2 TaxID=1807500 RepID=UPI0025C44E1D|nr:hypothetical protein [Branchiibius sp. NY16-3462-2]